ncbi:MAG: hypothetical protein JSR58_02190 [Verrucomicrobia bacterium]|nr:hypothetical protein [Verrucomicrobiota bacterium]
MKTLILIFLLPLACYAKTLDFSFAQDNAGWVGEFSDFHLGSEVDYELEWGWVNVPEMNSKAMFLSGNNHSDDLFMFIKRSLTDLKPNTAYNLFFTVDIVADVPVGHNAGIGGSPGGSVFFKVGASPIEPQRLLKDNFYYLNVDKGNQGQGGKNAIVVGNLQRTAPTGRFYPKEFKNTMPLSMTTDSEGKLWIFLGTDSGYEGSTTYFITKVSVQLEPQ